MIENLSLKISQWIFAHNQKRNVDIEVMAFSLNVIFNTLSIIFLSFLISTVLGIFKQTVMVMCAFAVLRAITGGVHIKSSELCIVVSTGMMVGISFISEYIQHDLFVIVINIISIIFILIYAPSKVENQTRISKEYYPLLKIIGVLIVALNFIFMIEHVALAYLIQSLTLIRLKGGVKV